jgi:hypothetical protein
VSKHLSGPNFLRVATFVAKNLFLRLPFATVAALGDEPTTYSHFRRLISMTFLILAASVSADDREHRQKSADPIAFFNALDSVTPVGAIQPRTTDGRGGFHFNDASATGSTRQFYHVSFP